MKGNSQIMPIRMKHPESGKEEEFLNMTEAAEYLGVSGPTLSNTLKRRAAEGHPIERFKPPFGRAKLVRKADLDTLRGLRPESNGHKS